MTSPIQAGYPDWGRTVARANVVYLDQTGLLLGAQQDFGPFYVGDRQNLGLRAESVGDGLRVRLLYFTDETMTRELTGHHIDLENGDSADHSIPAFGPWVLVSLIPAPLGSAANIRLWGATGPTLHMRQGPEANVLITVQNGVLAAGLTGTHNASMVWPGEAYWWVQTNAAVWSASLFSVNYLGVARRIGLLTQAMAFAHHGVFLPATHMRVEFFNNTAGAVGYNMALLARPMEPGR